MLWSKAETSGFTSEELSALKEEFTHHQDKIDQYYDILTDMDKADDGYKSKCTYTAAELLLQIALGTQ